MSQTGIKAPSSSSSTGSSSSSSSNNENWKYWAAGVGITAIVVGGVAFLFSKLGGEKKKQKKGKSKKKQASTTATTSTSQPQQTESENKQPSATATTSTSSSSSSSSSNTATSSSRSEVKVQDAPDEEELCQQIQQTLEQMANSDLNSAKFTSVFNYIQNMPYEDYTAKTRILSVQWLVLYHTVKAVQVKSKEQAKAALAAQNKSMNYCWELLNMEGSDQEKPAIEMLKMDVAQRLKDPQKLIPIFDQILSRGNDLGQEELMVLFTMAPQLGKWRIMRQIGDKLIRQFGSLDDFHMMALRRPDIPDYEVLFNLAAEEHATPDPDELAWQTLQIKQLRIRLRDVRCADEAKAQKVRKAFDPDGRGAWKDIPVENHIIERVGAFAQMLSLSSVPVPMAGPALNDKMKVMGYATLSAPQGGRVKQTETYTLNKNNDMWVGEYTLVQEKVGDSNLDLPTVRIMFDMEMSAEVVTL